MSAPLVVIMARAPRLGQVKRRLAAEIGDRAALEFYRDCLFGVALRLRSSDWRTMIAATPDQAIAESELWPEGAPLRGQGDGDLGARMERLLTGATLAAPAAVVGSDIPDIEASDLADAFAQLSARPGAVVLGPALDGGFWLIAADRPLPGGVFAGQRWSHDDVLAETCARLEAAGRPAAILDRRLCDIDDAAALVRWRERI